MAYTDEVNDPPAAPALTSPEDGATYGDSVEVAWEPATDPEGDALQYEGDYSLDDGESWSPLFALQEATSYVWDTSAVPKGMKRRVRVRSFDGELYSDYAVSGSITIEHRKWRERQADFRGIRPTGISTTRRPDAVSLDYLTAYTIGPIAEGDVSEGLVARTWRARCQGGAIMLAMENAARDGWDPDRIVVQFDPASGDVLEIDVAFEQTGRPVVVAERSSGAGGASEIWLYWFDPREAAFVFQNLGPGRTPRVVLDDPYDVTNSDVQLFYFDDALGSLAYRQQRDRYEIVNAVAQVASANRFLEDAARTGDRRLVVLYSERNPATGRYTLDGLYTTLFPQVYHEDVNLAPGITNARLRTVLLSAAALEQADMSPAMAAVALLDVIQSRAFFGEVDTSVTFLPGELREVLILATMAPEGADLSPALQAVALATILIVRTMAPEGADLSPTMHAITLQEAA